MSEFEISQIVTWKTNKVTDSFELKIKGDQYMNARAIIYGDWIAEKLAKKLGIKVKYSKKVIA